MISTRLKQFGLALSLIVSLFMSATAACACSHHPEKVEVDASSLHEHSETAGNESHHHASDADQSARCLMPVDECCCGDPAPKIFAKSENVKIEKHRSAIVLPMPVETNFVPLIVSIKSEFSKPSYLTDSFYNLAPGRAPPRF